MVTRGDIPSYVSLYLPVLQALERFNGSATLRQITDEVVSRLPSGAALVVFEYPSRSRSILEDRIAWAASYCFLTGLARRPSRGLYVLTQEGRTLLSVEASEAYDQIQALDATVHAKRRRGRKPVTPRRADRDIDSDEVSGNAEDEDPDGGPLDAENDAWRDELLKRIHSMSNEGFERLAKVVLESYGMELKHVGGPGDQGIDCIGIAPVSKVMSTTVAVQAKRRKPTAKVGRQDVALLQRDAKTAGAERAIMVTTGDFTSDARQAARQTAPTVHLINGIELCDLMRDNLIGVSVVPQPDSSFLADLETQSTKTRRAPSSQ